MSNYHKYTEEEDRVILSHSLRKKTGCVFMTVSGRRCTVNGKNVVILENSNTTNTGNSIWNRIKRFLGL